MLREFTFIRPVENNIENLVFLEQIQRIRRYYAGLVPEAAPFFASGTPPGSPTGAGVDGTDEGETATALASTGMRASRAEILFTAASMVGALNSILGGVGIASTRVWRYARHTPSARWPLVVGGADYRVVPEGRTATPRYERTGLRPRGC